MPCDPFCLLWLPGHELLVPDIVRAENCHLWDAGGKRYLDLEAGVWCTSIGHGHPRLLQALNDQAGRVAHAGFNYCSPVVADTARTILDLLGFEDGKCVLLCSGSEAVEYGVRVAQMVLERPLLMTMADSYCGAYGSANTKRQDEWFLFDWTRCRDCPGARPCAAGCEHFAAIPFDRIGGFLLEPGSSSGLVRFPPEKLIAAVAERVQAAGGLVLVNEVTTGIGRTGKWFGFQHYGLAPDIVAMGKGLGGGYPVSAAAFGPRAVKMLGGRPVKYAQSHQNDPLGAAVAAAVLGVITEEGLVERGVRIGKLLEAGLRRIAAGTSRIREVRARGLMQVVEFDDDAETAFTTRIHRGLVNRGFLVGKRPGVPVLRIDPALTVAEEDIEEFLEVLAEVITGNEAG